MLYADKPDKFTLKFHFDGNLDVHRKTYVGGSIKYVDMCDVDEMSYLEIGNMYTECGGTGYVSEVWYKLPNAEFESGMCPLSSDAHVLELCNSLPPNRVMYVYVHSEILLTQDYLPSQQYDLSFIDDPLNNAYDKEVIDQLLHLEGLHNGMDDVQADEVVVEKDNDVGEQVVDHSDAISFHGDSSNMDSTDDDVSALKTDILKQKKKSEATTVEDFGQFEFDIGTLTGILTEEEGQEGQEEEFSDYCGSEEERMAANTTDEEEESYNAFNEDTDMGNPKFEMGMLFCSANAFREAVRKQAIVERRPIRQMRNYGVRVKFVCMGKGCHWKIYASKMQSSSTYQIKTYHRNHTCGTTFDQKQISSSWLAKEYENDIRMNLTWPLASFQKKIINDWHCHVSISMVGRAKRLAMKNIRGDHVQQYAKLWNYVNEVKKAMPDSTIDVVLEAQEIGL